MNNNSNYKKLISIIVPIFNVEDYINDCIDSIIKQTYSNIEILLIDDGSIDNSGKICDNYKNKDERIRVYHKKNGGLSDARNYGIKHSKGDYLTFIDGDDIVSCDFIDNIVNIANNTKADIVIMDLLHCLKGNIPNYEDGKKTIIYKNTHIAIKDLFYQKKFLVSACGKIYKKSLFDNIMFPTNMIYEDAAIMYKLFETANIIVYNNSKKYAYIHRNNSITTKKFDKKNFDIIKISKEILKHYSNNRIIKKSSISYYVNANMRIFLTIPNNQFINEKNECSSEIRKYGFQCLLNIKTRFKLRISIILFFLNKKILKNLHKRIDRWS